VLLVVVWRIFWHTEQFRQFLLVFLVDSVKTLLRLDAPNDPEASEMKDLALCAISPKRLEGQKFVVKKCYPPQEGGDATFPAGEQTLRTERRQVEADRFASGSCNRMINLNGLKTPGEDKEHRTYVFLSARSAALRFRSDTHSSHIQSQSESSSSSSGLSPFILIKSTDLHRGHSKNLLLSVWNSFW